MLLLKVHMVRTGDITKEVMEVETMADKAIAVMVIHTDPVVMTTMEDTAAAVMVVAMPVVMEMTTPQEDTEIMVNTTITKIKIIKINNIRARIVCVH